MSQQELGEKTRLRQGTISAIETGETDVGIRTLLVVLAALDLELQVVPRSKAWQAMEKLF